MRKPMLPAMLLAATFTALAACNANPPPAAPSEPTPPPAETPATTAPATPAAADATTTVPPANSNAPAFVDRVWRVTEGGAVEAGSTYTFRADGALLMDAPHGTPSTGSWSYADDRLTMTEEGITYAVDIVLLEDNRFTIRSHNPGGAVVIAMQAAPDVPLPQAQ